MFQLKNLGEETGLTENSRNCLSPVLCPIILHVAPALFLRYFFSCLSANSFSASGCPRLPWPLFGPPAAASTPPSLVTSFHCPICLSHTSQKKPLQGLALLSLPPGSPSWLTPQSSPQPCTNHSNTVFQCLAMCSPPHRRRRSLRLLTK